MKARFTQVLLYIYIITRITTDNAVTAQLGQNTFIAAVVGSLPTKFEHHTTCVEVGQACVGQRIAA